MTTMQIVGYVFLYIGAIFLLLGSLGILRMPDLYTRMQAGTKSSTLGAISSLIGIAFLQVAWMPKVIMLLLFIVISNPISSHALSRAAHKLGTLPFTKKDIDMYETDLNKIELEAEKEDDDMKKAEEG